MNIRKTDGSLEEYSVDKVINGIKSAYKSINEEIDENLIKNIADNLFIYENMTSTEIRRLIENALMSVNKKVAREYMSQYDNRSNDINFKKKKSDFIKNYIEASNAATGSKFDANANVSSKNVVTMGTELYKEENIKENRYLLYDRIKMMYSKKIADRYIYDLDTHRIYKHDETAIPGMPYTYSAKEVVEVKYSDRHFMIPFDLLWEIVKEEEVLVNDIDNVYQKYPEDLFVKDRNNIFTKITALTKKERKRDLVRVKTSFGEDVVVTDNHPMIVNINDVNNTVEAINSNGCKQYKINDVLQFDDLNKIDLSNCPNIEHYTEKYCSTYSHSVFKRELILDEKFGYFVGFFVGDGNYNNSKNNGSIVITQKNRETLEKLNDILFESLGVVGIIRYKRDKTNCYSLTISNDVVWWLLYDVFMIQDKSENKTLPINILETNENFAKGVLGGLIDADGTINDCQLTIRLSSRSAIVQATNLLRHFGYGVGNIVQHLPFSNNKEYNTNYSLWGVNSSVRNDSVIFEMCEKLKKIRISESSLKYNKAGETKILSVEKIEEGDSFLGLNTFIYDITTETRTFACNNLLVHNCVAITMYPFLIDGLTGLGGQSKAPTDLKSFCGEFINLVYSVSSQFAGACMYKDQKLFIKENGITRNLSSKEFVSNKLNDNINKFENFQGVWEYSNIDGIQVAEDGKFVNVKKVYRRKYDGEIYVIKTKDGRTAKVSKDHKFKVIYRNRILEVKAEDLIENDTVFVNKDFSFIVDDINDEYKKGWIKGIICGDGCITRENEVRLSVHSDQSYYADIFNDYSSSVYGNTLTTIRKDNRCKCIDFSKYNGDFYKNVCEDIIGNDTYTKHIDVTNKSVDFLLGFVDGLLCADGSYTKSKGVTLSLTNEKLIENVSDIINMIGYEKPSINKIKGKGNRKDSYSIYIRSTFLKYLKHTHLKKLELENIGDSRMKEISIYGSTALKNTKSNKRNLWSGSHRTEDYMLDVIDTIEVFKNDDEYVYEIETESHWYNCGGFITHNCATPEFLMYFDYFLRKDYGDDYITMLDKKVEFNTKGRTLEQVIENGFQQIIHSMNMPAGNRGYQCVREDTTQLMTPNGFKYLGELKEGDECYVWKDGKLLIEPIKKLNVYDFDGELYQFSGRNYQQTVTDSHRVLYKVPNTNKYDIKEAKDLFGHSKLSLPIGSNGVEKEDFPICDELLKLCVITLTDGSIDGVKKGDINSGRIKIYKSKNRWGYREIPELLNSLGIGYTESEISGNSFGEMVSFTIPKIDSQIILRQIEHTKKSLPRFMKMLSKRQIDIVVDIWSKIDGTNRNGDVYLQCDNDDILNDLQEVVFLGGYGSEIKKVKNSKFDGSGESYTNYVRVFKRKDKRVSEYKKVYYKGRVWCPTTDAGIVVFREENKIPYISGNSVFWNVGYFDKGYFDGVFGEFVFPDGTTPKWETLSWLQKKFMKWFNDERTRYTLTFPVETMACLTDGNDLVDKEYADFTAEMYADGHSFFTYLSDSPDSLSSCCFSKDTKVLWKSSTLGVNLTTLDELHNTLWEPYKKNLRIFHNGSWVKGKTIELPNRTMYKVITENNKEFIMTDNHINVTMDGEKQTSELTTNDYLMFNTMPLNAVPENDEKLTYEQGFVVGAFLGDGSFGTRFENGTIYEVNFSQNENKYFVCKDIINEANRQLGGESICSLSSVYNNVYPLRISSKKLVAFIQKWTNWKEGTYYYNKELNLNCLLQSVEFRKGILDGWYNTDGGNTNRCYTTSKKLIECMEVLVTSLGMQCVIDVSDKTDEKVIIRGEEYNRNYPLYCLKWYTNANNRKNKDANRKWIKKNNSIYFKIKSIEKIDNYKDNVYCIECDNKEEPYFTLPCGLITHNCRLRNSLKDNIDTEHNYNTHQFSMGTASVATGSKSVMTINLNRIIQNSIVEFFEKNEGEFKLGDKFLLYKQPEEIRNAVIEKIKSNITEVTENVHKYQTAFNSIIKDFYEANMLDVYKAGFIDMRKQYLTVGVNGLTDAAEFLGIECSDNDEYKNFVNIILETINIANRKDRTRDCMFNTEFVPGENLSNKNYNWDKKDGYFVSDKHIMYSSYFFNPEDDSLSVLEKMRLHGKDYVQYLDGGSACHINLAEHLDKEQNRKLLKYAASVGCNYFTYNVRNTACNSCGYISKHDLDKCPHCGSEDVDKLTRIIGYLKRVKSFAEPRQVEEGMRFYNKNIE